MKLHSLVALKWLGLWLCASMLLAQTPEIAPGGVVNAATLSPVSGIEYGVIITIFGKNLSSETVSAASLPLPRKLGKTTVLIEGASAPLLYVSPTQINAQMPVPAYPPVHVAVNNGIETSQVFAAKFTSYAPGIFTLDGSGCGTPVVLDGLTWKIPSAEQSFAPGDIVTLLGTGTNSVNINPRIPPGEPTPPEGRRATPTAAVLVDGIESRFSYYGLAPGMVGVDQINFQIPPNAPEGCSIPLELWSFARSQQVPLRIKRDRGKCVDYNPSGLNLTLIRNFSSGLNQAPPADAVVVDFVSRFGRSVGNTSVTDPVIPTPSVYGYYTSPDIIVPRPVCPQFKYLDGTNYGKNPLNAGPITFSRAGGVPATLTPTVLDGRAVYPMTLLAGTLGDGPVQVSTAGGADVRAFQITPNLPPFRFLSDLSPGSAVNPDGMAAWTFRWEGGGPDDVVVMSWKYPNNNSVVSLVEYASKGSMLFYGLTGNPNFWDIYLPPKGPLKDPLIFTVYSSFDTPPTFSGGGLTLGGRIYYRYVYQFGGLVYK